MISIVLAPISDSSILILDLRIDLYQLINMRPDIQARFTIDRHAMMNAMTLIDSVGSLMMYLRQRRNSVGWVMVIALVALSVAGCGRARSDDSTVPPPETSAADVPNTTSGSSDTEPAGDDPVALPQPDAGAGDAVSQYLAGPGANLVVLRDVAARLPEMSEPDPARCGDVLDGLSAGPPPDELGSVAGDVPDEVLSSAFIGLIAATDEVLTRCRQGDELRPAIQTLERSLALVDARLEELR